jgi:hypothetical protein
MSSRLLVVALSALLAFASSACAQAADSASSLLKLHQLRLLAQKSLGDFYMYMGMEGDQRYARMIERSLQDADTHRKALGEMPGAGSKALRVKFDRHWEAYEELLQNLVGTLKAQGFTDLQPIADLYARNQELLTVSGELYGMIQQESGARVSPLIQRSREQSLLMQTIALDYASRSASVGATFFGGNDGKAIDELAREFANELANLEKAPQNTPQIKEELGEIGVKWRYIEKSLTHYNENSVPFLINKYSDRIIEGLENVSAQYAATKL